MQDTRDWRGSLYTPTQLTEAGGNWYLSDCWHHRILCSPDPSLPLCEWKTLPGPILGGHTVAGNGRVLLADNTDRDQLLVYDIGKDPLLRQVLDVRSFLPRDFFQQSSRRITALRPHCVLWDSASLCFVIPLSRADGLVTAREEGGVVRLDSLFFPEELRGSYLKFVSAVDGALWAAPQRGRLIKFLLEGGAFRVLETVELPPHFREVHINYFTRLGPWYILTTQERRGIYAFSSLKDLSRGRENPVNLGQRLGVRGIPYLLSPCEGGSYLTEIMDWSGVIRLRITDAGVETEEKLFDCGPPTCADRRRRGLDPFYPFQEPSPDPWADLCRDLRFRQGSDGFDAFRYRHKALWIYGAGERGFLFHSYLSSRGIACDGFLESRAKPWKKTFCGLPVRCLDETMTPGTGIIAALSPQNARELLPKVTALAGKDHVFYDPAFESDFRLMLGY